MTESESSARLTLTAAAHGRLAAMHVNVPEARTALAQEVHTTVLDAWCERIDGEG